MKTETWISLLLAAFTVCTRAGQNSWKLCVFGSLSLEFGDRKLVRFLPASAIRQCYEAGQAWGRQMYQVLLRSKIVLNHHGDIAPYANNLRLFEATGMGALLLTDWKENLEEMFEPGKEIGDLPHNRGMYRVNELLFRTRRGARVDGLRWTAENAARHNYTRRMEEFVEIVRKYL